jgi:hypothetical protein
MDYSVDYDPELDAVVMTTRNALTVDGMSKLVDELIVELRSRGAVNLLGNHSESSAVDLQIADVRCISELASKISKVQQVKRFAVVLVADLDYGMGRMWQILTEDSVSFEIGIFRSLAKARAWLSDSGSSSKAV